MAPKRAQHKKTKPSEEEWWAAFVPDTSVFVVLTILIVLTFIPLLAYPSISSRLRTFGVFRDKDLESIHGLEGIKSIPGTLQCEDLHHHRPSNQLYAACQVGDASKRYSWFPPLDITKDHKAAGEGTIVTVDPVTFKATDLKLEGFSGPFVTHGFDIYSTPTDPTTVHVFAVNHLPNPDHYYPKPGEKPSRFPGRSQIEIFRHKVGSSTAQWVRSIRHPLIRTPNDIYATSESSFYVTNDHFYRDGFMRIVEGFGTTNTAGWTDTVHVKFGLISGGRHAKEDDAETAVQVTKALEKEHNNNGLGHGPGPDDVLVVDAGGGVLTRTRRNPATEKLTILERIQFESNLDNPTYYFDEYKTPGNDASGYVLGGLAHGLDLAKDTSSPSNAIPVIVWHATVNETYPDHHSKWNRDIVFQDNGYGVKSASAAVIVGIDPKQNSGRKEGWVFVTGFMSDAIAAVKIDLNRPVVSEFKLKHIHNRDEL
ncbi:hypothetical protein FH972_023604 [Carpinus fangiana]|uniref:Uncharacterized protein n=1 Tax=Carpinus fangiana TaxID=176857 RepID=A0A5N6KXX4_9ROSI|nr:hypothetical protein FH972_023604 [Carpinus fangiana]